MVVVNTFAKFVLMLMISFSGNKVEGSEWYQIKKSTGNDSYSLQINKGVKLCDIFLGNLCEKFEMVML